jgi:hypothetical protein
MRIIDSFEKYHELTFQMSMLSECCLEKPEHSFVIFWYLMKMQVRDFRIEDKSSCRPFLTVIVTMSTFSWIIVILLWTGLPFGSCEFDEDRTSKVYLCQ